MKKYYGIIYKATNKINGKFYIGQTTQRLSARKYDHVRDALKRKEKPMYFHNAIQKYGPDNFEWEILKICNSANELDVSEIDFIKKLDAMHKGYNRSVGGRVLRGKNHPQYGKPISKKIRKKISLSLSGPNNPMYGKTHTDKSKLKISFNTTYHSGKEHHLYGKPGYFAGKKRPGFSGEHHPLYGKKFSKEIRDKISDGKSQYWLVYYPDGNKNVVKNLEKFCKFNNISSSHLYAVARGERNHCKGYKCKKLNEDIIRRIL